MSHPRSSFQQILETIPPSASDSLVRSWGFDLVAEYALILTESRIPSGSVVLELATGTGRMTAVLTRLGFHVITGDTSASKVDQMWRRVGPESAPQVSVLLLDMRSLPFKSESRPAITCLNTLHELESPRECLEELVRVHDGSGALIVGDFNDAGFDAMQRVHEEIYHDDHPRGSLRMSDAELMLRSLYRDVRKISTPLNDTLVASRKK